MSNGEPWEIWELPGGCLLYLHSRFGGLPSEEGVFAKSKPATLANRCLSANTVVPLSAP